MAALTKYARDRHIEITPLVQGFGHATFILKHEAYAGLRELPWNHWAFCPLNEGTYQVLFDLYRDAIKATPGSNIFISAAMKLAIWFVSALQAHSR
jgi:hypothetical protein